MREFAPFAGGEGADRRPSRFRCRYILTKVKTERSPRWKRNNTDLLKSKPVRGRSSTWLVVHTHRGILGSFERKDVSAGGPPPSDRYEMRCGDVMLRG